MSSFDSVTFYCPKCGEAVQEQSKAGDRDLKSYHQESVPAVIANEMKGRMIFCPVCDVYYRVACEIPRVNLYLTEANKVNGYD